MNNKSRTRVEKLIEILLKNSTELAKSLQVDDVPKRDLLATEVDLIKTLDELMK